jgi:hypothetical protein
VTELAEPHTLLCRAEGFAENITDRIRRIFGVDARFRAVVLSEGRAVVGSWDGAYGVTQKAPELQPIILTINKEPRIRLFLKFHCCWDVGQSYLAIEESWIHVSVNRRQADPPMFRYEYVRSPHAGIPSAHLHIHAHRDEISFLMMHADRARPKRRKQKDDLPAVKRLHFPLGGARFRPCLEDICQMLVEEFGVDVADGYATAIREGREEWRRTQIRTAVRDSPEDAIQELRGLGYTVTPPDGGHLAGSTAKLQAY